MSVPAPLLKHPTFSEIPTFADLSLEFSVSAVNVDPFILDKNDPRDDPKRAVFSGQPYIYAGRRSFRGVCSSAHTAGGLSLRNPLSLANDAGGVAPLDRIAARVSARCSVNGNKLRVRVTATLAGSAVFYLEPVGNTASVATNYMHHGCAFTWNASARDIEITVHDLWESFGFEINIPIGVDGLALTVASGTDGAQTIDIGEMTLEEISRMKAS